jgi:hypothetical protein
VNPINSIPRMDLSQFFADLNRGNIRPLAVACATAGSLLIAAAALLVETFAAAAQGIKLLVRALAPAKAHARVTRVDRSTRYTGNDAHS